MTPRPLSPPRGRTLGIGPGAAVGTAVAGLLALALLLRWSQSSDGFGAGLSLGIKTALIPLVHLVNAPGFVYGAATVIVLSAFVLILLYRQRVVVPRLNALKRAEFQVKALAAARPGDWRGACAEIGTVLARHDVLSSTWPVYVQEAADAGRLPPRRFAFYAEADPSSEWNRQGSLMGALPGYYTTIGLILTFVGLVVALYFAARGFRSGDMAEARQSIIELLNASAFKFLSSVAALFSAFMVSIAHRIGQSRLRLQTARLLAAIDGHLQAARIGAPDGPGEAGEQLSAKLDRMIAELAATRAAVESLLAASSQGR
jgi:hypothetical protein